MMPRLSFLVLFVVRAALAGLLIGTREPLSVLIGVGELISCAFAAWNQWEMKAADRSPWALLVVVVYVSGLFIRPEGTASGVWSWILGAVILGTIVLRFNLGRAYSVGTATWVGLVDTGVYRFIRHPQMLGWSLSRLVYLAAFPTAWNLVVCLWCLVGVVVVVMVEERFLRALPAYADYCDRVRWRLLPRVW